MEIKGRLLQSTKVEQITDSFKKCNIILETEYDSKYPQEVSIEVHNANIDKLKGLGKGDIVDVEVNLRGRKYSKEGKPDVWFNSLVLWKITVVTKAEDATPAPAPVDISSAPEDDDSLPF